MYVCMPVPRIRIRYHMWHMYVYVCENQAPCARRSSPKTRQTLWHGSWVLLLLYGL